MFLNERHAVREIGANDLPLDDGDTKPVVVKLAAAEENEKRSRGRAKVNVTAHQNRYPAATHPLAIPVARSCPSTLNLLQAAFPRAESSNQSFTIHDIPIVTPGATAKEPSMAETAGS